MKRYIKAATNRKKPITISTNKLRSGIAIRDRVYLTPYASVEDLERAESFELDGPGGIMRGYSKEGELWKATVWANNHNIPYSELSVLNCEYIIDTLAHLHTAALSDNEDITLDTVHIRDAIQQVCEMIQSDLQAYDNDLCVIGVKITVTVYGYGNYKVIMDSARPLLNSWGADRYLPSREMHGVFDHVGGTPCYIVFNDALKDNTSFRREQIPSLVKALAIPIQRLQGRHLTDPAILSSNTFTYDIL